MILSKFGVLSLILFANYKMNPHATYIGLIDCNNFFASCERIFDPTLRNRPLGIVSNVGGCFIARSNELKALGVPMGAPYFQYEKLVKENNVVIKPANFSLYSDISKRIMRILKKHFPKVEVYSIDEAFICFSARSPQEIYQEGKRIHQKINQWIGVPVSIGIATTKTLAKIACKIAKHDMSLQGVFMLDSQSKIDTALKSLPVSDIWGIGRRRSHFLYGRGIQSAYEFSQLPEDWVKKHLSICGLHTLLELKNIPCFSLEEMPQDNKSILRSRTFHKPTTRFADISEAIAYHITQASQALRAQQSVTATVGVFIRTNRFSTNSPQNASETIEYLSEPSDYTPDLLHAAQIALKKIYKSGFRYAKAGVYFPKVLPALGIQRDLFTSNQNLPRKQQLMQALDSVTEQYGSKALFYAAIGTQNYGKRNNREVSPRYTTHWEELPVCG